MDTPASELTEVKYLSIQNMYFQLPPDFEGGISDALRALADYHDQVKNTPIQEINPEDMGHLSGMTMEEGFQEIWRLFGLAIRENPARRVVGKISLAVHDLESDKMIRLSLNSGERED